MGRKTKLTPQVQQIIVAYVRQGAYEWVAAQAAGVTPDTFRNWMRWGSKGPESPYFGFFMEVNEAHAQARVLAEIEVRKQNPFNWLRYGPGREKEGKPGWTESHQVDVNIKQKLIKAAMAEGVNEQEAAAIVDEVLKSSDG